MYNENFCIRRIKELMKKNDDTLYRLSKRSGVSLSTLASMFEKNTDPRVETIEKICAAFDITISQFFDRSSPDLSKNQHKLLASFNSLDKKHQRQVIAYSGFLEREDEGSRYNKK